MSPTQNSTLRTQLLELAAADYALRTQLAADGTLFEGYNPQMKALHQHNSARLQEIIAQHGWPGRSLVEEDGTEAAWRFTAVLGLLRWLPDGLKLDYARSVARPLLFAAALGLALRWLTGVLL